MTKPNHNMALWDQVKNTPLSATKTQHFDGRDVTTINAQYVYQRATELFGPIGKGWGFDIITDRFDQGAPILGKDGGVICHELMHTVLLKLWYVHDGERCYSQQFGHTPFVRRTTYGVSTDFDAPKKSVTDAIKKCLSLAGFCADVHLGMFDDATYLEGQKLRERLEGAGETGAEAVLDEAKGEFASWLHSQISALEVCPNERALEMMRKQIAQTARAKAEVVKIKPAAIEARINEAADARLAVLKPINTPATEV
ncbi:hypothetical protein AAER22_13730 [Pseudomonas aeruginosa]|uniref:Putative DNA repair protein n=1 Tax=Pseudomonas phage H66 TaxID=2928683 RepID=L7TP11_9CAUD|nr:MULTISPECIES: hypothetical protein [Pseudomonas]YP_009638936.1 exonuclease [Pseudomonas phage H66]AGC34630.1 putative DNA repair protein [Pseudomonas phage H66]EKG0328556.1 hypothetical protein [Pseudomonas aeruginosa]EKU6905707.1 hypothetical protein [Pseudomonas aeruginosa]EKV8015231.1 hypothetical protein [Pseudomonas aeruginosa]ELQ8271492.1 hypothetical protein [Pseudomonas aeruginosa]